MTSYIIYVGKIVFVGKMLPLAHLKLSVAGPLSMAALAA
jgi:hypothetical protein